MVVHPVKSIEVPDVDFILKSPVATVVPGFAEAFTEISTFGSSITLPSNNGKCNWSYTSADIPPIYLSNMKPEDIRKTIL